MEPVPPILLAEKATRLKQLVTRRKGWRVGAQEFQALQTRAGELERFDLDASGLATALAIVGGIVDIPPIPRSDVPAVRKRVRALSERIDRDGVQILLRPRALDALKAEELISDVQTRARRSWNGYVLEGTAASGLDQVLSRYAGYKAAGQQLDELRNRLALLASALPVTKGAVTEVTKLRQRFAHIVSEIVKKEGLSDRVVEFLRRAMQGVPLAEVLGNDEVLAWLKDKEHVTGFSVRAQVLSTPSQPGKT